MPKEYILKRPVLDQNRLQKYAKKILDESSDDRQLALDAYRYFKDMVDENPIPSNTMTTAIYYVNTCDGFTEFEDGTKTEAVANRLVKFPANLKHRGVSQLDNRFKCVINFNFFEKQ